MPNWATDEPAAISDNSLSRRKEESCVKGGEEIGNRGTAEENCGGFTKKNGERK